MVVPTLTLKGTAVARLMKYVWQQRNGALDMAHVKGTALYRAVLESGVLAPCHEWLLERAVRDMHTAGSTHNPAARAPTRSFSCPPCAT